MLLPRSAILGVALAATLALPATSALGDTPPTADLSLSMVVWQAHLASDPNPQRLAEVGPPMDPSAPVMIADQLYLRYTITNNGADPASFSLSVPNPPALTPVGLFGSDGYGVPDNVHCAWLDASPSCTGTLAGGESVNVGVVAYARAPGLGQITATVIPDGTDPDPSDDVVTWSHEVTCQVTGTEGDDVLVAHAGQAACGLGGNDTLIAEAGSKGLFGGPGDDTLDGSHYTAGYWPLPTSDGGPGFDTVTFASAPNSVFMCPNGSGVDGNLGVGPSNVPDIGGGAYRNVERIIATPFNDYLTGNGLANVIDGGGGNDIIVGGGGDDTLNGGAGNDRFVGRDNTPDVINGGPGVDHASADHKDRTNSTHVQYSSLGLSPCA